MLNATTVVGAELALASSVFQAVGGPLTPSAVSSRLCGLAAVPHIGALRRSCKTTPSALLKPPSATGFSGLQKLLTPMVDRASARAGTRTKTNDWPVLTEGSRHEM